MSSVWDERPEEPTQDRIMGKMVAFPRRTRSYGFDYKYTGQTQVAHPLTEAPALVREAFAALTKVPTLEGHNAVLLNWYDAELGEYMGAHSDDERDLVPCAPVLSLSWCSDSHYRRFRFTPRPGVHDALTPVWDGSSKMPGVLNLRDGCLVVMGGFCQATHKHELLKTRRKEPEEG